MKKIMFFSLFAVFSTTAFAQFDSLFLNQSLRFDYYHSGDKDTEAYFFDEILVEPFWGGSQVNLIDTFQYGKYFFEVHDAKTDALIYSRGYSSLFGEWQTTDEAKKTAKSFTESVVMPFPKEDVRLDFFSRDKKGIFLKVFSYDVDIDSYFIKPERRLEYPSFDVMVNGDPAKKVDIVILPEGYTESEMGKFIADCQLFTDQMLAFEPYASLKDQFNVRGVLAPSLQSGNDIPADSVWKKSIMNTSYYTFDSERYCMTTDHKSVRDLAANAPYDQIYILVNNEKYGGGAIYNFYSVSSSANAKSAKIYVHEFGHGFAGLGDEYFNSEVAFSEFYPIDVEPWEPNITTLVDFDSKWKSLLPEGTPVPTADSLKNDYPLGVYEGGGYVAKGVYRPSYDCLMNTFNEDHFCGACQDAIKKMIRFYTE